MRQSRVQSEYLADARDLDREHNRTPVGSTGPVERKVLSFGRVRGLVFGSFGEASPDVYDLVKECGDIGAARGWRDMGAASVADARAVLRGRARRHVGIEAARGMALYRLDALASILGSFEPNAVARHRRARTEFSNLLWAYHNRRGPQVYSADLRGWCRG